jgi:hypothetical protein
MNESDQKEFDRILKLSVENMTWEEKVFLTARRGYINSRDIKGFQGVIESVLAVNEAKVNAENPKPVVEEKKPVVTQQVKGPRPTFEPNDYTGADMTAQDLPSK